MMFKISWCRWSEEAPIGGRELVNGWEDVSFRLESFECGKGSMSLVLLNGREPGPIRINLIADNKFYLVTLLESSEEETVVREYFNPDICPMALVELVGDMWDPRHLTQDFDFVCKLFKDFYTVGDVPCQCLI